MVFSIVCLFQIPQSWMHLFREPENCNLCHRIKKIDRIENINPDDFESIYAYSGRPVIVTDGTKNWSPLSTFTFEFFRDLYKDFEEEQNECQFFPYKTEFLSLSDALNMSIERAHLMEGTKPWYFGWSSCNKAATKLLRQHYTRPYFLPTISESTTLDWIFMGGPGDGAHLHIDGVKYPSWQAQLSGRKLWRLVPPPECYFYCHEIEEIVSPGEIIVVDTNRWYHQTFIVSTNVSITIGSEYN
ncbi:uncharacterized protein LOC123299791 [Chrysoperla carnea]|uniref:uncharacterized protein LOC123299791 n=1 Tax=Chrysoperla carnea TaxID=189513 RepID=UPI001D07BE64|nr:uncharacterized protein LOC123299791 [Chrysoperla carnea]